MDLLERELEGADFLLGDEFSGADVMVGYSVFVAKGFGVLAETHANLERYLGSLLARPALRTALKAGT